MANSLPILTSSVREVTVDIAAGDLRRQAEGYDVLILRVTGRPCLLYTSDAADD